MKVNFIHAKDSIMEAIDVSKDRMDEIVEKSRLKLLAKHPTGTKTRQLDYMLRECKNENELIAATIVWVAITNQMDGRKRMEEMSEQMKKDEFANKLKITR